ncbi:hypothetical protein KCU88_g448, partial [Aureobasidium melanogenum]
MVTEVLWLGEEGIHSFRVEHLVDEWRIVTRPQGCIPEYQSCCGIGIPAMEVVEHLSTALAGSHNGDAICFVFVRQNLVNSEGEISLVEPSIGRARPPQRSHTSASHPVSGGVSTPPAGLIELEPRRQERAQIGKLDEPVVLFQIIQECEIAARVSKRCKVFDEGYLHPCTREQHPSVPFKCLLSLEETDFRTSSPQTSLLLRLQCIAEGDGNGEGSWSKSYTDQVVNIPFGGRIQHSSHWCSGRGSLTPGSVLQQLEPLRPSTMSSAFAGQDILSNLLGRLSIR